MDSKSKANKQYGALAILAPLVILGLWALVTMNGAVSPTILPSPMAVAGTFVDILQRGYSGTSIWVHVGTSLWRVGVAFAIGSVLGIALGLLRGRLPAVDALFLVPSELVRPIPPLGLIPLFILWFGIGELSKIL